MAVFPILATQSTKIDFLLYTNIILIVLIVLSIVARPAFWGYLYSKIWQKRNHNITLVRSFAVKQKIANNLADALVQLSGKKIGSIILIERSQKVTDFVTVGARINADINPDLIINIFSKNTPLHDGGIIIRKNKIVYAACYFPLLQQKRMQQNIPLAYGSRHRAAIEITKLTDAVCFVTSETTGKITFSKNKNMYKISNEQSSLSSFIMNCLSD